MKNTQRPYKLFLDTSVLLSGLNSPFGASGTILSCFKLGKLSVIISPEVIKEAEVVIQKKFPFLATAFLDFLSSQPIITASLTRKELKDVYQHIPSEDAPIAGGALKSKAQYLVTLDKRFQKLAQGKFKINVIAPGEFLKLLKS